MARRVEWRGEPNTTKPRDVTRIPTQIAQLFYIEVVSIISVAYHADVFKYFAMQ